jgi:hypothetical protein
MVEAATEPLAAGSLEPEPDPFVYVAMSPNPELQPVYLKVIKPTLESHGFTCRRSDTGGDTAIIATQVFEYIDEADLVLCDLTYANGPTYYELGIAHAFRKTTILISQQTGDLPFDTRYQRALAYKDDRFSLLDLRDSLSEILRTIYPEGGKIKSNLPLPQTSIPLTLNDLEQARVALFHHSIDAKRYALRFLGDNRDSGSYDKIRSLLDNTQASPELVRDGVIALAKIDPERAIEQDLLGRYGIYHPSHIVREQVVHLIGRYPKTDKRVFRMIDQITDSSWGVRVAVCQVLGNWRATEAVSILTTQKAVDPETAVRVAAEEALQLILAEDEQEHADDDHDRGR